MEFASRNSAAVWKFQMILRFLISNFRRVLSVVCLLLGNSPTSEFYMPTFRNTLFHFHRQVGMKYFIPTCLLRWNSVPKRRHIKFRRRKITQKKAYMILRFLENLCTLGRSYMPLYATVRCEHLYPFSNTRFVQHMVTPYTLCSGEF